ncbi:MAG: NAD-dependent epimerase/dehydratase family protein [Candidatus Woesearchaeota archaeon]
MKIIVTGGCGFIGSNLVDELINQKHNVVVIDNLSTGKKENLNKKAVFYKVDIREKEKIEKIFKKEKPEIVFHHAAQIDVRKSVSNPEFDASINILGLINLLKASVDFKVKKFINISSGGVIYGENAKLPIKETESKNPVSPYGISKYTGELYVEFFNRIYGLRYTTLRYSNVYGPRQDPLGEAGVISIFSNLMLNNKRPTIFGDGKQTRDYVFVKDVVSANILAIEKGDNEAFNIGTMKETSVNDLFRLMKKILKFNQEPIYAEPRAGELLKNCLDNTKAKKILGWKPEYDLEKGLIETINWLKN